MEDLTNYSEVFGRARVKIMFKRRWVYHLITVFFQSVLLLGVAYMTFYFKISNFQDRIMIAITTMMVVATIQSSINKMVPKTSYIKMIDVWLLFGLVLPFLGFLISIFEELVAQLQEDADMGRTKVRQEFCSDSLFQSND